MIGIPNISRLSHNCCHASAVADHVIFTDHNIRGTILKSSLLESQTCRVELKELYLSVIYNPHLTKTLVARSCFFINFKRKYQLSAVSVLLFSSLSPRQCFPLFIIFVCFLLFVTAVTSEDI